VIQIKIFDVIGYSGSGKTYFIEKAIELLKKQLNYNIVVIKNVKHHRVDKEGKDSYRFTESGALYSIITNNTNDVGIYLKTKDDNLQELIKWLQKGPYHIDLFFTEGFRHLNHPTLLCVRTLEEIESQLNENVKMISGIICSENRRNQIFLDLPIVDIEQDFQKFLTIFNIK
jgi:molybdopterin-guanine dinucleotide biosynthesis protein MobB